MSRATFNLTRVFDEVHSYPRTRDGVFPIKCHALCISCLESLHSLLASLFYYYYCCCWYTREMRGKTNDLPHVHYAYVSNKFTNKYNIFFLTNNDRQGTMESIGQKRTNQQNVQNEKRIRRKDQFNFLWIFWGTSTVIFQPKFALRCHCYIVVIVVNV